METSIKEVLQDLNAGKYPKPAYRRDNREVGAVWPAPNSQDLPDDSMDIIDPS